MDYIKRLFEGKKNPEIQVMPAPTMRDSGEPKNQITLPESSYTLPAEQREQWEAIVNRNVALLQQFADVAAKKKESHAGEWSILRKDQWTSAYFPRSSDSIQIQFNPSIGEITGITFSDLPPQKSLADKTGSTMFKRGVFDTRFAIAFVRELSDGKQYKMINMENFELLQAEPVAIAVLGRSLENFRIQQGLNQ